MDFLQTVQDGFGKLTEGVIEKEINRHLGTDANAAVSSNPDVFQQHAHGEDGDGSALAPENKPTAQPTQPEPKPKTGLYLLIGAGVAVALIAVVAFGGKK